jgi:uncharacterized protein (TIGR00297 family)
MLFVSFLLALLISLLAWRANALSESGALAATLLGTLIFGLGGWPWAVLLLLFFFTSSALTRAGAARKSGLSEKFAKGGRRDALQVLANGGIAGLCVLAHLLWPQASWPWVGFAASLAAVNADTWATELGVLASRPPRRLTTWQIVEKGTSGGVTLEGTLSALLGAALISLFAVFVAPFPEARSPFAFSWITLTGLAGAMIDSLLGDTFQAIYYCPNCRKQTERHPRHTCGAPTFYVRGLRWLDNDIVNLLCGLSAALLGILLFLRW